MRITKWMPFFPSLLLLTILDLQTILFLFLILFLIIILTSTKYLEIIHFNVHRAIERHLILLFEYF